MGFMSLEFGCTLSLLGGRRKRLIPTKAPFLDSRIAVMRCKGLVLQSSTRNLAH